MKRSSEWRCQYGILSPNQTVKRVAFESYLQTSPILSIRFNGEDIKDSYFSSTIREHWNGTLDSDNVGYWRIPVGEYRQDEDCYAETLYNDCFITVNSDGVFLTPYSMNARAIISDEGLLTGSAILRSVDDPVPFTIRLID